MIVTCQECQTQFQLDDAKVPETGIRVRCSRCKCAFFVESPHRSDPDHAEQLARDALGAGADLPSSDANAPEEESDWEFNEDVAPDVGSDDPVDELSAARSAVDDLLGGVSTKVADPVVAEPAASAAPESESGFDLATDDFGTLDDDFDPVDPVFGGDAPGEAGSAIESEPDLDPNAVTIDSGVIPDSVGDSDLDSDLDLDTDPLDDGIDDLIADSEEPEPEPAVEPEDPFVEASEDLGTPADWDFFEDADPPPSAGMAPASDALDPARAAGGDTQAADRAVAMESALDPDLDVSAGDAWFTRLRGVLGWAFVIGMCGYASVAMFLPGLLSAVPGAGPIRVAGFEAIQVEGHWVENVVAGPIYVVSGALHDTGGVRPATGSVLRVRLLDERSGAVAAGSAVVGPPIPTLRLRESNPRDLRAAQERGAAAILEQPLARRKRRPFMAVLTDVPPSAVAFDLQVAEANSAPLDLVGAFDTEQELDGAAAGALAEEGMAAELPAAQVESAAPEAAATEPAQAR